MQIKTIQQKLFIGLLATTCTLSASAQQALLEGEITSKNNEITALALSYRDGRLPVNDTLKLQGNSFSFSGSVRQPVKANLSAIDASGQENSSLEVYLSSEPIKLKATGDLNTVEYSGSAINQEYQHYLAALKEASDEIKEVNKKWQALDEEGKEKFSYERRERLRTAGELQRKLMLEYIEKHPESYFSLTALYNLNRQNVDVKTAVPLFDNLAQNLQSSYLGKSLKERIDRAAKTEIGVMAPDFTQDDPDGNAISLSDFRGQYVLIDFWASWCGPCRAENPNLKKAYEQFKDRGFTVLGVSLDNPGKKQAWLDAIEKDGLPWKQVSDLKGWGNEAAQLYSVSGIPASFLVDPEGKIIAKSLRGERLFEVLDEVLPKK